jgi:hypothetical protein
MPFEQDIAKFTIASIDDNTLSVSAQYNPKELQYDRSVSWIDGKYDDVEYKHTEGRALTIELFFDGFEKNQSVQPQCSVLDKLATVIDVNSNDLDKHRPHYCIAHWSDDQHNGLPTLRCVIENVQTKYTMFGKGGIPLRATCTVKLKEACILSYSAKNAKAAAAKRVAASK